MNNLKQFKFKHIGEHAKPIIDKITIVAPSPNTIYKDSIIFGGTVNYEHMFLNAAYAANKSHVYTKSVKGGAYTFNTMIYGGGSPQGALLQMGPKHQNGKNPFMRIEFNPNKLGYSGMALLAFDLDEFVDTGFEYFWDHGKATRVDVAVDFYGVEVGQFRFLNKWGTTERVIGTGGMIETIYLGKSTSNQTKIYNKAKEAKLPPDIAITRVERSIRTQMPLKGLSKMPNQFLHLALAHPLPAKPSKVESHIWEMFSDSVEVRGPASALSLLPKPLRKVIVSHLESTACDDWNPKEIWSHWPNAVQPIVEIMTLPPSAKAA